jgi:methanogenic corrinoid protein MtbC1
MTGQAEQALEAVVAADRSPLFNTAAVAHRTGLPPATFRVWERRYGFPKPARGPNQQRSYSEQDIEALIWLRQRLDEGLTISAAVALLRDHLTRPARHSTALARPPGLLAAEAERALLAFDAGTADAVLGEAHALFSVERVCLEVLQPVLLAIGEAWHQGRVDAAQEHFASTFVRRRLVDLLQSGSTSANGPLALAACAPNDWHELGLLMVAVFLARHGWRVVYLGPSLPLEGLLSSLRSLRPAAVVLSATTDDTAAALAEVTRVLHSLPPPRPLIGFGGGPFEREPALREATPGLYLGPSAATAVARLEQAMLEQTATAAGR